MNLSNRTITTTYLGDLLVKETVPDNWKEQVDYIIDNLKKYACSHNDIKPREIVIKDNKICIVDFGWATLIGEKLPFCFPKSLGSSRFRYGVLNFNDHFSFCKSIEYILEQK